MKKHKRGLSSTLAEGSRFHLFRTRLERLARAPPALCGALGGRDRETRALPERVFSEGDWW